MKGISLIGSTGSIGRQVCSVVRRHSDKFKIESLVANASAEAFLKQVIEFKPKFAALADERAGQSIAGLIPQGTRFVYGEKAVEEAISYGDVAFIAATETPRRPSRFILDASPQFPRQVPFNPA